MYKHPSAIRFSILVNNLTGNPHIFHSNIYLSTKFLVLCTCCLVFSNPSYFIHRCFMILSAECLISEHSDVMCNIFLYRRISIINPIKKHPVIKYIPLPSVINPEINSPNRSIFSSLFIPFIVYCNRQLLNCIHNVYFCVKLTVP